MCCYGYRSPAKIVPPRDLAVRRIQQFIAGHEIDDIEFHRIQRIVFSGISLRIKHGLIVSPSTEMVIIREISKVIYLSSQFLNQPPPDKVEFLTKAEGGIPDQGQEHTRATCIIDEDSLERTFKYSPYELKGMADCLEGVGNATYQDVIFSLANFTAHESFHVHQHSSFPDVYEKDTAVLNLPDGKKRWCKTVSERMAVEFGEIFAQAYSTPTEI